jgi:hypothetical protein
MREGETITPELEGELARLAPIEAIVGVATLNSAATVDRIIHVARRGAALNGRLRTVVVHADDGSQDATVARALEALRSNEAAPAVSLSDPAARRSASEPAGPGALRSILQLAQRVNARGCAVLDATMLGAAPEWVGRLLTPVLEQEIDFVAPYYVRQRLAGAIVSSIVYPMTRALYGKRLRFPLAEDFACSPRLLARYLSRSAPRGNEPRRGGPELWVTTQALSGGYRLRQVVLGAKRPPTDTVAEDLAQTLTRVLGALFAEVERDLAVWQKVRGSEPVALEGSTPTADPGAASIDGQWALDGFRLGLENLRDIWGLVLPPTTLLELKKLAREPDDRFRFPDQLWARTVYDFALAYRLRILNRDHLLAAFTPLYLGWLGGFVAEAGQADARALESRIEQLCLRYEMEKPYLISRWRWPDRFNP